MDVDTTSGNPSARRQGQHRRRLIAGIAVAAVVAVSLLVIGNLRHSTINTSGALSARACPTVSATTGIPSIAPAQNLDWSNCNLTGAKLNGADLTGSSLQGAIMTSADVTNAVLTNVNLNGIRESGTLIGPPKTLPSSWLWVHYYLIGPGVDLSGQDLGSSSAADMTGANLRNAVLTGANLTYVDLTNADVSNANLTGATIRSGVEDIMVSGLIMMNTTCPNGQNSSNHANSCAGQGGGW